MKTCFFIVSLLSLTSLPGKVWSWGLLGHRVTGGIAEHYLTPKTRTAVRKLLGNETVALASTWADFIRSNRSYDTLASWHYVNIKPGLTRQQVYEYLDGNRGMNVYNRMNFLMKALKSGKLSHNKQVFYLKLLIHLVGDAHQPMHAGRADDRGGNGTKVYWFNDATNLHRLWDEQLVEFQQLSYTEHVNAINFPAGRQKANWEKAPMKEWIYESYLIAQQLYGDIKAEDRLTYNYNYKYAAVMNEQLLKGGIRLAAVLNDIYGR